MKQLTRYWITFDYPARETEGVVVGDWTRQVGFGVTAADVDDAMAILRREWFDRYDLDVPPLRAIVQDVARLGVAGAVADTHEPAELARDVVLAREASALTAPRQEPVGVRQCAGMSPEDQPVAKRISEPEGRAVARRKDIEGQRLLRPSVRPSV